jgi:hypothetical protein
MIWVGSHGSRQGHVLRSSGHGSEHSGSIQGEEFLKKLNSSRIALINGNKS